MEAAVLDIMHLLRVIYAALDLCYGRYGVCDEIFINFILFLF